MSTVYKFHITILSAVISFSAYSQQLTETKSVLPEKKTNELTTLSTEEESKQVARSESINWNGFEMVRSKTGPDQKVLSFTGAQYSTESSLLPLFSKTVMGNIVSVILRDEQYSALTEEEQKFTKNETIGNAVKAELMVGYIYGKPHTIIKFAPFRKNEKGAIEKLVAFNMEYEYSSDNNKTNKTSSATSFTTSSVLSQGNWFKMQVSVDGIYKIDKNLLASFGININNVDPRNIHIHGYGKGMLPQRNTDARYDDLPECAIYVQGEGDGVFNDDDYILFYANGPDRWYFDNQTKYMKCEKNLYSDACFYYLTINTTPGKRITTQPQASSSQITFTKYDNLTHYEQDLINIGNTGRSWFGDEFYVTLERTYTLNTGEYNQDTIRLFSGLMASSENTSTNFNLIVNNRSVATQGISAVSGGQYSDYGNISNVIYNIPGATINNGGSSIDVKYRFFKSNPGSKGYQNFITVNNQARAVVGNAPLLFRSIRSRTFDNCTFQLSGAANTTIWDVTDPLNVKNQEYTYNGEISFAFNTDSTIKEFAAFGNTGFNTPSFSGTVINQNLHALTNVNFVIIANPLFVSHANRLAAIRNSQGINTYVTTPQQIYEEFSSGRQDVTAIRDFMKMLYNRSLATTATDDDIKYLLLFGDCSYDYKNRITANTNLVPVYESIETLDALETYSSEDYYGFLDDYEGEWPESNAGNNHLLDIGIGRIPAENVNQADLFLQKLTSYSNNRPENLGKWRNQVTLIADDNDNCLHSGDADAFYNIISNNIKELNVSKIYLDSYMQVPTANEKASPECKEAINNSINKGSLITNYTGHGNEIQLTSEKIIDISTITTWDNPDKLTFMVTGTCEFGRYDNPQIRSGAEQVFVGKNNGAIGMITTTRPVFSYSNSSLNQAFYLAAFDFSNGTPKLGDIMQKTKNNSIIGINNRNFALFGDPTMELAYPEFTVKITSINGDSVKNMGADTLNALQKVKMDGVVMSGANVLTDFNGKVYVTVFEKEAKVRSLGDEGINCEYKVRKNVIFDGPATVTGGKFSVNFVVPKDINYQFGFGKVLAYADNGSKDANGYLDSLVVGGTADGVQPDNIPPVINLYMNDESFVNGGLTNSSPLMIAKFFDDNGINTSGLGIGHEITAVIDDEKTLKVLNEYYTSELDDYQRGRVQFPYKDLKPGLHVLKLKAWDTHNNSSEERLEFIVASNENLAIQHVLNYPNPFSTNTSFHFDHNRQGDDLETRVDIYTVSGKLIKTLQSTEYFSKSHVSSLHWDGRDDYNDKVGNGVYIYKLTVRSVSTGQIKHQYEKLVILN